MRVYSLPLWPDDWPNLTAAARADYRQTVLANIATQFDLSVADLEGYVFETSATEDEAPFLVLAERFDLATGSRERLNVLGRPGTGTSEAGPELQSLGTPASDIPASDIPVPDHSYTGPAL